MMGVDHALGGLAAGVATLDWCPTTDAGHQAAWVASWTGAALLCDWDSPRSMASRMWGPLSGAVYRLVSVVGGGHRHLTHDLVLFPLIIAAAVTAASQTHWGRMIVVAVVVGLAVRALLVKTATPFTGLCTIAVSAATAWWTVSHNLDLGAGLLTCLIGGILVHLAGDAVTVDMLPMPVAWLFGSRARLGLPLFRAGKTFETLVVLPAHLLLIGWLTNQRYQWWPLVHGQLHALHIL